jgi:hypothetical protein
VGAAVTKPLSRAMWVAASALALLAASASAQTPRNRLLDVGADVLEPGETQFGALWGYVGVGLGKGIEVSSHLLPDLLTLVNARAKMRLLARPELRASVEASVWWLATGRKAGITAAVVPMSARASIPLPHALELELAGRFRWFKLDNLRWLDFSGPSTVAQDLFSLGSEVTLVRYDALGAFYLQLGAPLFTVQRSHYPELLGKTDVTGYLPLDDSPSWSIVAGRDHCFGKTTHVRLGVGYRHQPGLFLFESLGNLVLQLDWYWR